MSCKAADDLLELINLYFKEKTLYLTKKNEDSFSVIKTIENVDEIDIREGDTRKLEDGY